MKTEIKKIFGDGKKTIELTPLNTRPDCYVVRIDSSVDIDDNDSVCSCLESEDGVFGHIEYQYGIGGGDGEPFPALDISCGYCWEELTDE